MSTYGVQRTWLRS